jgi:hypothetical protein
MALSLPAKMERGQTANAKCAVWGSEMGRWTSSWYTGSVVVEIKCPEGIEITPARLTMEMKRGPEHNKATADVTVTVRPNARLGKYAIVLSGVKADGRSAIDKSGHIYDGRSPVERPNEIEVTEADTKEESHAKK